MRGPRHHRLVGERLAFGEYRHPSLMGTWLDGRIVWLCYGCGQAPHLPKQLVGAHPFLATRIRVVNNPITIYVYVYIYICMCVIYIYIHIMCIYIYVYMYVCVYIYIYTYIYLCMYKLIIQTSKNKRHD